MNRSTPPTGIQPLFFRADPAAGIPFPTMVIEITPEEYQALQRGDLKLPNGWRLDHDLDLGSARRAG